MTEKIDKDRMEQWKQNVLPVESAEWLKSSATSAGSVPLGVYRKAQHALAHGAKESQVENMINDWLRENGRPANFSFTQNTEHGQSIH